jgi:DNA-binding MarR family transcriptional regulator
LNNEQSIELFWLIIQCRRLVRRLREKELAKKGAGVSPEEAAILFAVKYFKNDARLNQISQMLVRERNSISTLMSRMERKGLILKVTDPDRKNRFRVVLTESGEEAYSKITDRKSLDKAFSDLQPDEHLRLVSYLHIIRRKTCAELKAPLPVWPPEP